MNLEDIANESITKTGGIIRKDNKGNYIEIDTRIRPIKSRMRNEVTPNMRFLEGEKDGGRL